MLVLVQKLFKICGNLYHVLFFNQRFLIADNMQYNHDSQSEFSVFFSLILFAEILENTIYDLSLKYESAFAKNIY